MPSEFHVALLLPPKSTVHLHIQEGVVEFARKQPDWQLVSAPDVLHYNDADHWHWDGMIVSTLSDKNRKIAANRKQSLVYLSAADESPGLPCVWPDNIAVGTLAAEHLLALGMQHFAFFGDEQSFFSCQRRGAFLRAIVTAGFEGHLFDRASRVWRQNKAWQKTQKKVIQWLKEIPRPCAIFACDDKRAQDLAMACKDLGVIVPEEIAILGVNNDELICNNTVPTLSSVAIPGHEIGFTAAHMLDQLMRGGACRQPRFCAPSKVLCKENPPEPFHPAAQQ